MGCNILYFVCNFFIFKPLLNQFSVGLENKIEEFKKSINESKALKLEAEKMFKLQLDKQKENIRLIKRIEDETKNEIKNIKFQLDKEIEQNMLRKINNYSQLSSQMENKLKDELKNEIIGNVIKYTESRIKNNLSKKFNEDLIDDSLKNIPKQLF